MSLPLPTALVDIKNSLDGDVPVFVGIKVEMAGLVEPMRLVNNDVDIDWTDPETSTVETWVAFPFEIDDVGETQVRQQPQVVVRVSNVSRVVQGYVDRASGGVDATVWVHVFSETETTPFVTLKFKVDSTSCNEEWVTFSLTCLNMWRKKAPRNRCLKNYCSHRFGDVFCAYAGSETSCDHTLKRCREIGNSARFGGFPSAGYKAYRPVT